MDIKDILSRVDHTLLRPEATWEQIKNLCDEGIQYGTASVCIPPCHVRKAAQYLGGRLPVCTVIGFPNGYSTTAVKSLETSGAIDLGAEEIDMVINLGWVKEKKYHDILTEIKEIKAFCEDKILKVIIETCLLTEEEKTAMCRVVSESGADFIKTSTGFSKAGATLEDIRLFKANVAPHVRIKAAGGISTLEEAAAFIEAGADRIGASRLCKLQVEGRR